MTEFDIAIIGGGPGGYVAAIRAAQQGACVCLVEQERVGGTCLNHGCIPTKALFATALLRQRLAGAALHGISCGEVSFDYGTAAARKESVVEKLVGGVEQLLKANKVDLFHGSASIEGPGRLRIRSKGVVGHIRAKQIIVASGSLPARPKALAIDGKNILTSREILAIKELPGRLLIIGGGYIGCEFASIFAALGSQVTVVEQLPELLARSDRQVVREVEKSFKELGIEVRTKTAVESLEVRGETVVAGLSGGETLTVDKVLVAVGRVPNSSGLGLEEAGVELERGAVKVDERMRTSVDGIYAIGDVTNIIQLAHVASYQGEIAVTNALGGDARADYRVVPSAIFTLPEVGQVGLTEAECKEQGVAVEVGRFAYQASSKALCDGEPRGLFKVVAAADGGEILGAAAVGEEASTLIAEVALAMQQRLTPLQLAAVIHAHPTLPELVREAAEDCEGLAVHKVGRRRSERKE
uniref:dihydrolipoyl dehydrogenase n=1 Tax=Desulfuromonas sp. DDH964 TaxID=1823759 RepID=UPI00078C69B8|nr:dihydrolipoyl dehydrogenase [Desulfuromonas sp. DDH964]AMV71604.1 dihydrolipoamide dehydrogenase [Desulfuromonas sp. DDH964]